MGSFYKFNYLFYCNILIFKVGVALVTIYFSGGALKPTDVDTLWVHVTCAWFRPEVEFLNHEKMEPAVGMLRIPPNSFVKVTNLKNWSGHFFTETSIKFFLQQFTG